MRLTYETYLNLDEVLGAARPVTDAHDELLFVIAHQAAELWLKLVLHELEYVREAMAAIDIPRSVAGFIRCRAAFTVMADHFEVLATMTPESFAAFRDALGASSGAQSAQFRQLAASIGPDDPDLREDSTEARPTVNGALYSLLWALAGSEISPAAAVVRLYRERHDVARLFEVMIDFDEAWQAWRYRHAQIAARMIGGKAGTGGTSGAEYLRTSAFTQAFPVLWRARELFYAPSENGH